MVSNGLLLARMAAGAAGAAALVVGTVFALTGGDGETTAAPLPTARSIETVASTAVEATPVATETQAVDPGSPTATSEAGPDLAGSATVAPVRPVSQQPPPTSSQATATPAVITDLPVYKDTQVLAMAASVVLPSGKTFEQCVALGPNGARWPVPVHLYYEGKGKWLVETHLGEVATEFDEATATFKVKHFAPEANECLR